MSSNRKPLRKLIIQIPCYNEEKTLAITLSALPRTVPGFDKVEWLIIDDGSKDRTVEVARAHGVDHVVRHTHNLGLARAFMSGMDAALKAGADVIVNTDADNQYNADDIPQLVEPLLQERADIVIGARPILEIAHFSPIKKALQGLGSWAVRVVSRTDVRDAPSGFRAFSRVAASRLIVFNGYTYTLETIIQAGQGGLAVTSVPIRVNADLRPSRLVRSISSYVFQSLQTILRIYIIYSPFKFFLRLSGFFFLAGMGFFLNFAYHFAFGREDTHVPSLVFAGVLCLLGFLLVIAGILADLQAINRKLLEDIRWRLIEVENNFTAETQRSVESADS